MFFKKSPPLDFTRRMLPKVRVQGVKSLGGHFACLCREFDFYEVKINIDILLFFKKKREILLYVLSIIFIVKSLQKEQNSTNLLL